MTNRPRDLFNLLRCVGHPASRSFLSFAKRYCDAYRNDFGWVSTGASNIPELNLLMKEVMLRRTKEEVLDPRRSCAAGYRSMSLRSPRF